MSKQTTSPTENTSPQSQASADVKRIENKPMKQSSESSATKRMTVVLPADTAQMLELLSEVQSVSLNEAIRRAISTEAFIQTEVRKRSRVLVETEDGETKELIFR